jgi:hypothetical protein
MTTSETSSYSPTFDEIVWALAEVGEYDGKDEHLISFKQRAHHTTALAVWLKYKDVGEISELAAEMVIRSFYDYCDHMGLSASECILLSEQPERIDELGELINPARGSRFKS